MKRLTTLILILLISLFIPHSYAQEPTGPNTEIGGYPELLQVNIPLNGAWRPGDNPLLLQPGDFADITNMRYNNTGIEGVSGYSKINTSVIDSTYLKIRNGFHFVKDEPTESHVLVQAYNSGLTASQVYENTTAIPSAGNFSTTALHTDASTGKGRFATAPQGTMVYCNEADRPQVWAGDEGKCMSFITSTAAIGNSITNPRDYTDRIQNTLQTSNEVASVGGGTSFSLLMHCDGADAGTTFTDTVGTHSPSAQGDAQTDTAQLKFGTASGLFDGTGDYITIPDHANWNMGTGKFTVGNWIRFNTLGNGVLRNIDSDDQGDNAIDVITHGDFIVIANYTGGIHTYSRSSTGVLTHVDSETTSVLAWDLYSDGDYVYMAALTEGVYVYSIDGSGTLTLVDSDDLGGTARGIWGDGDYIYVANDNALLCYSVSAGVLTHVDSDNQGGTYLDVWGDGTFVYTACHDAGLRTHSVNSSGTITYIDNDDQGDDLATRVWGDGTFVYVAYGGGGIHSYSVNASGILSHIHSDDQGGFARGVWGDGNFIYLANDASGLLTYSVNAVGTLTYIDADDQGGNAYNIWGDGDYVFLANDTDGLHTYSQEHTVLWQQAAGAGDFVRLYYEYNNYLTFSITSSSSETVSMRGAWSPNVDTWYYIELLRGWQVTANGWALTVSGADIATTTDTDAWPNLAAALEIGKCDVSTYRYFDGWIDEFFVWKGVAAHSDDFTPPNRAYDTATGYFIIGSPWRLNGAKFYVSSANTITSTLTGEEWSGTAWTNLANFGDGTSSGAVSLSQTGLTRWDTTENTSEQKLLTGYDWYWYQFSLSAGSADIYYVTVDAPFQNITNIWDGTYSICAGAWVYEATNTDYWDYADEINEETTATVMVLDSLEATNDFLLLGFNERQQGLEITFPAGKENSTASTTLTVYYWTGSAYSLVSSLNDGTSVGSVSFASSGVISWAPPTQTEEFTKTIAGEDLFYYYKLVFDQNFDSEVEVYFIEGIPVTEDILPYKFPLHFQNRTLLLNRNGAPSEVLVSHENTSYIFNGPDSAIFTIGSESNLTAAATLSNSYESSIDAVAVVCKDSETWALREPGDGGPNFIQHQLSETIGCPAPLTMDSYEVAADMNLAVWLSYAGPYVSDGITLKPIPGIEPYFDPLDSSFVGYSALENASGFIDPLLKEYNLIIGDNWLIYDIQRAKWFKKEPGTYPECGWRVQDTDGGQYCYLGYDTGYMMRNENTNAFDGSDISQSATLADMALGGLPHETQLDFLKLTVEEKSGDDDSITVKHRADGATAWTTLTAVPMFATGDPRYVQHVQRPNKQGVTHQLQLSVATDDKTKGMTPLSLDLFYRILRTDTTID